jgi:hypothetical protein
MSVNFDGTLFSNFHAFAFDVRWFEFTFEIRLSYPRFNKYAVSIFRVDESEVYHVNVEVRCAFRIELDKHRGTKQQAT